VYVPKAIDSDTTRLSEAKPSTAPADVTEAHHTAEKQILHYLKGTINYGLVYKRSLDGSLTGFCDADWAGDMDSQHSTTGNLFVTSGAAISWLSRVVALLTTKAEYIALCAATQEAIWFRRLLIDFKALPERPTTIREDYQGDIVIAKNPIPHARTSNIDVKFHFVREALSDEYIELTYCPTEQMVADVLTKPLNRSI